jgi:ketosteroid isomerase-like protein
MRMLLSVLAVLLLPHPAADRDALQSLVEAERAFARTAVQKGIRDSFLEYFADDAIALGPAVKRAKDGLRARPPRPFSELELTWEPRTGDVAAAGDLGWLTGPSTFIDHAAPAPQPRYGNYLSIWRRQPTGEWRVLIDVGCQIPAPAAFAPGFAPLALPQRWAGGGGGTAAAETLKAADQSLNTAITQGGTAHGYATVLAESSRLHRQGVAPHTGRAVILSWLEQQGIAWTSAESRAAQVSASGDLGYSYGLYQLQNPPAERGTYLRVWARDAAGRWWVVADVTEPAA